MTDLVEEEEDVPLARRRKATVSKKRKTENAAVTKSAKRSRKEKSEMLRRGSGDSQSAPGWPRLASVFGGQDNTSRVRKPTAKVQPFVHRAEAEGKSPAKKINSRRVHKVT